MKSLRTLPGDLLTAYGALFVARHRGVGFLVFIATLCDPVTGVSGLTASITAWVLRALLRLPVLPGQSDLLTAIYVGLVLGAFFGGSWQLLVLAAFGGALAIPIGFAIRRLLSSPTGAGLPLLGAPFLATAWLLLAAARAAGLPMRWAWPAWPNGLPALAASALAKVGALFYVAHPIAGVFVLAGLLISSRITALLALGGAMLAQALAAAVFPAPSAGLPLLVAFNGALSAMFLGGVLVVPGLRATTVAAGGVLLSTVISGAMLTLTAPLGLPPLSAPFVLSVWMLHAALRPDVANAWSRFWKATPSRPEDAIVAGRLAAARGMPEGSVALRAPFLGCMEVAQSFDGEVTHQGLWRYALDFVRTVDGVAFRNDGADLADFHAFDQPVVAPAYGLVVACRDDIADNAPGSMNLVDNWGNYVIVDIGQGFCVLLAHLKQGSLTVTQGQYVVAGQALGRIGNSGRSAQPHLHLHVQRGPWLGAPTVPFHLVHSILDGTEYSLDALPRRTQKVEAATPDISVASAFAPSSGSLWRFRHHGRLHTFTAEFGLLGNLTLVSDRGAVAEVFAGTDCFALHGRRGAKDPVLDAFMLTFGLTPFSGRNVFWQDAPAASLLPMDGWQRLRTLIRWPFGANLRSRYTRRWDALRQEWRQIGTHRLPTAFGTIEATTLGRFSASQGPIAYSLVIGQHRVVEAELVEYGNRGDHGVPSWTQPAEALAPTT